MLQISSHIFLLDFAIFAFFWCFIVTRVGMDGYILIRGARSVVNIALSDHAFLFGAECELNGGQLIHFVQTLFFMQEQQWVWV